MNEWEAASFNKLGNDIMEKLTSEVDPTDPKEIMLLGHDTKDKRDERMTKLKENMKAATTDFDYGRYPWDPVSQVQEYLSALMVPLLDLILFLKQNILFFLRPCSENRICLPSIPNKVR